MTFYFNLWVLHLCSDTCTGTPPYVNMHTCIHCTHEKCIFSISSIKKSNWERGKRLRNSLSAKLNTVRGIFPVVLLSGNQEILIVFANPISDLSRNCTSYFSCCCNKICDKCILKTDGSILAQSLRAAGQQRERRMLLPSSFFSFHVVQDPTAYLEHVFLSQLIHSRNPQVCFCGDSKSHQAVLVGGSL